jgi:hypothetical protein
MRYEILVAFNDETACRSEQELYFRVADKYKALCIGHDKTGTSSLLIRSDIPLNLEQLSKDLGEIKILEVGKAP